MRSPEVIDGLDSRIIEVLQVDGRLPNTEIARRLGVAEATIRSRIDRLLRNGIMQIGAWTDPLKIGYQVYAIIELQVNLREIERVAEELVQLPEIFFLGTCLGHFDIFAAALFRSNDHLHTFLTKHLCRVRGVERASTTSLTRILKREYRYPTPVIGQDGPARRRRTNTAALRAEKAPRGDGVVRIDRPVQRKRPAAIARDREGVQTQRGRP